MIKLTRQECPNPRALLTDYKNKENKEALKLSSFDKCMYCESKISHIDYGDVEHIKPKSKYPEFEFVWDNLGLSCIKCNRTHKSNKYHVSTLYINPFDEDPSEHILALGSLLFQKQGSERGEITIKDIGLNRPELVEKRQVKIDNIDKAIKACFRTQNPELKHDALNALKKETCDDKEYSLVIKTLFQNHEIV